MKCPITNREDMIDDCHITIEFGYGSKKDCMTYTFSPVHDEVGQKVLELIESMIQKSHGSCKKPCVEDFGRDVMEELFSPENWGERKWGEGDDPSKDQKGEWGI
jgi:hypothetical protein